MRWYFSKVWIAHYFIIGIYILYESCFSFRELAGSRELSVTPYARHVAIRPLFGLENIQILPIKRKQEGNFRKMISRVWFLLFFKIIFLQISPSFLKIAAILCADTRNSVLQTFCCHIFSFYFISVFIYALVRILSFLQMLWKKQLFVFAQIFMLTKWISATVLLKVPSGQFGSA